MRNSEGMRECNVLLMKTQKMYSVILQKKSFLSAGYKLTVAKELCTYNWQKKFFVEFFNFLTSCEEVRWVDDVMSLVKNSLSDIMKIVIGEMKWMKILVAGFWKNFFIKYFPRKIIFGLVFEQNCFVMSQIYLTSLSFFFADPTTYKPCILLWSFTCFNVIKTCKPSEMWSSLLNTYYI